MTAADTTTTPDALFREVIAAHAGQPGIAQAKMFGSAGLRSNGKVFACLFKDKLVVKLPMERVESLVAAGTGARFDPGMGRQMKEWVELPPTNADEWRRFAAESLAFVESLR
jgi:hypothetical protein